MKQPIDSATPRPTQRRWAYVILVLAGSALILEALASASTPAGTPFLRRYGNLGLPISIGCIAFLLVLPPRHPLLRVIWAVWILTFGFWLVSFVAKLSGGI